MSDDSSIRVFFDLAAEAVRNDSEHHLRLGWRQAIWTKIGPREGPSAESAKSRRAQLAAQSARKVLPIWIEYFGDDEVPKLALDTASAYCQKEITTENAKSVNDALWDRLLLHAQEKGSIAVAAGFSAVQALNVAIHDEFFDPRDMDLNRDDDNDPDVIDSAYYGAIAAAGGLPGDPASNPTSRLNFWVWWLKQAQSRVLS